MFDLRDISVEFLTARPIVVVLALAVLLALTVLLYRRTNPPLPTWLRLVLAAARAAAVVLIALALLEPVLSYRQEYQRNRRVAVLLDRSTSMERLESGKTREVRMDSLLSGGDFDRIRRSADVSTWYFGGNLESSVDKVQRDRTAIGDALSTLDESELAAPSDYWLLFSDGNSNSGRQPQEAAAGVAAPITAIEMAQGTGAFDVGIADVEFNTVVFVGQPTEVKVKIALSQAAGQKVRAQIREKTKVLAERTFDVTENGGFGEMTLTYSPDQPGQHLLQVHLPPLPGESTEGNNTRTIAVKALKSRLSVLLVSKGPDYEVGFLLKYLRQSDRYDVTFMATGSKSGNLRGQFPTAQADLNRYDLVILHDPDPSDLQTRQALLKSYLDEKGGGVWVMMGQRFASSGSQPWLNALLPIFPSKNVAAEYREFRGVPAEGQLFHPAVRLAEDRTAIRERWSSLPPFEVLVPCDQVAPDATPLVYASSGDRPDNRLPILAYRRLGPGKVIASAALPFWTWGFEPLAYQSDNSAYGKLLDGVISWLTVQDDFDPVRIAPEKAIFSRGEPVRFDGSAYDLGFRPIPGVTGVVKLSAEGRSPLETDLLDKGDGKYSAEFTAVPPGQYEYEGILQKDGDILKRQQGQLLVETFSLEEFDQQGDPATLMAAARASGGNYYPYDRFGEAVASLDLSPVLESVSGEYFLWGKLWVLLLFIGLLALEWALRKANHLI
jgi:hypothetical protein